MVLVPLDAISWKLVELARMRFSNAISSKNFQTSLSKGQWLKAQAICERVIWSWDQIWSEHYASSNFLTRWKADSTIRGLDAPLSKSIGFHYYQKIWALFLKHFAAEWSPENIAEIEARIESLIAGYGDVSAFGINLNAEKRVWAHCWGRVLRRGRRIP